MLPRIAVLAAVLLWAPGVGMDFYGGKMISPYEVLILLMLAPIVLVSLSPRRLVFALISVAICLMSYLNSVDRSASGIYLAYYLLIIIPHMLLFLQIFEDDTATRAFMVAFVKTAVWLGPLAFIQFLSPFPIWLINNTNYALQLGLHRAQLFTPEASILAALYTIAICVAMYNSFLRIDRRIPSTAASYLAMAAGLASTLSTSAYAVLPPLVLLVLSLGGVSWKKRMKYLALGLVVLVLVYLVGYQDRIATGDSTKSSLVRFATMLGGATVIYKHWITGLGLGMNKSVIDFVGLVMVKWTHSYSAKAGIDSFQLALMVEMGVLPGLFSILGTIVCYKLLRRPAGGSRGAISLVAMFSICVWFVSLLTSGYRGLAYCWLFFPAGYVVYFRTRLTEPRPAEDPAGSLVVAGG